MKEIDESGTFGESIRFLSDNKKDIFVESRTPRVPSLRDAITSYDLACFYIRTRDTYSFLAPFVLDLIFLFIYIFLLNYPEINLLLFLII